jgi:hypothetical protein
MSWEEALLVLMRRGVIHEPSATQALVLFARARGTHITLEQAVEKLPVSCRGQARLILRDARSVGVNDFTICHATVSTYEKVTAELFPQRPGVGHGD